MTPVRLACVVEGHGEMEAVPVLVRRLEHIPQTGTVVVRA
jgi:hypothetical protein